MTTEYTKVNAGFASTADLNKRLDEAEKRKRFADMARPLRDLPKALRKVEVAKLWKKFRKTL
jgi:hypothetical protein